MKIERGFAVWSGVLLSSLLVVSNYIVAQGRQRGIQSYACPRPQGMCTAANMCGSTSSPCRIDIKRRGSNWASATPNIPGAKANAIFCVKLGTTITWESSSKNTGFVIDFGPSSPFDTAGAIMGGADRPISVIAKRPGCFKYSAGACTSGTIYGMCGSADAEVVISDGSN